MASDKRYDIVIAGGGMVGASLALMLAAWRESPSVLMVEANPQPGPDSSDMDLWQPSFDARSTALSYSSRQVFESIGLWTKLAPHVSAITQIQVSDRGHLASTRLHAHEQAYDAYGYVVENRRLGSVLYQALTRTHTMLAAPATVEQIAVRHNGVELALSDRPDTVFGKLLVIADGARSATRDKVGITARIKNYDVAGKRQMGLIANIELTTPHHGVAYERFTDEGPMALLPLPDVEGAHRSSLVWTLPADKAAHLQSCPEPEFLHQLHNRFGYRQGPFKGVGERYLYPLTLMTVSEQVRHNIVVVGNAAHSLHPVAGQGFNLALRDIAALSTTLAEGVQVGNAPGDLRLLQRYLDRQQSDQHRTIMASDWLPRLFGTPSKAMAAARGVGLMALDLVPELREQFARYGMGLETPSARL